ncbi:LysR substrate-binding domain-containing protein [Aliiruegeria sabulilitoris]|uniref:LysR substrate-binding domain-containing protein n=1 Tax=Aliiruegeria sabulilitoris TaxID=1510458 RepID=UPI00083451F3|nr:LysR substrate-binding domain-containing protein [Aliiruegeria sabulilitoris]NDR59082.1 LysR family transcriptional regulator [Pseudoruegeria sp. M32A2M]
MKLPPLNALKAFEAAARHGGFIAAADELCVTRGAVSRHVKTLEAHVGVPLFRRHARGVELTEAGRELLPVLTNAFGQIAEAADRLSERATDLRIICPPATSIRWLIPRLEAFRAEHPEIRLRLTTDFHGGDGYVPAEYDVGFSFEFWPGRHPEIENRPLFPILLSPACAPAMTEGEKTLSRPQDLARFKLLHETADRTDWRTWLDAFPADGLTAASGDVFPNLDMATRAAVIGAGVVMGDLVLCREELERGLLRLPFPDRICRSPNGDISLIAHRDKWDDPKVRVFSDWIHAAAAVDRKRCASLL